MRGFGAYSDGLGPPRYSVTQRSFPVHDVSTPEGRRRALWDFGLNDHAVLRLGFQNAHWIGPDLVRTNHPWPHQLKRWQAEKGIRTVINLRGVGRGVPSFYALEEAICRELGIDLVSFQVFSREAPSRDVVFGAKDLFQRIAYPALMHCKSGADRAGIMSVLYRHVHLGEPVRVALEELSLRRLHVRHGKTGVLDYVFERYFKDGEPRGMTFLEWVDSPLYDPVELKATFRANPLGSLLTEGVLRRE